MMPSQPLATPIDPQGAADAAVSTTSFGTDLHRMSRPYIDRNSSRPITGISYQSLGGTKALNSRNKCVDTYMMRKRF